MESLTGTASDPQALWETAQLEIALEGSSGCSLDQLWKLMKLEEPSVTKTAMENPEKYGDDDKGPHPSTFLRQWLWRTIVVRRGKELYLTKYSEKSGEWENLARGDAEDCRIAAVEHVDDLKGEGKTVGVVASPQIRLRALGLDTSKLRSISLVTPLYVQVLEVVGKFRGRGATIDEVLDGVNALNKSSKKDEFVEVVTAQSVAGRGPSRSTGDASVRDSGGMVPSQFYPVYDRLTKAGLLFKSIMQMPASVNPKGKHVEMLDSMSRFIMLYLSRFQDHILLEKGCRLEPTAREVFLEMVVRHVLEATGGMGDGAVVPFQSIRQEHSLDKHEASRLKNFLMMEARMPDSPIKLHMLDLNALTYETKRGGGRLELCVSLKRPVGIGLFRSVLGIVKSLPEEGANVDLMRKKLHLGKKCAGKVVDLIVERPNTYGIWKGYTREGRAAKVQALFYDKNLRGRGNTLPGAPSIVKKVDVSASSPTLQASAAADAANTGSLEGNGGGSNRVLETSDEAPGRVAAGAVDSGDLASLDFNDDVDMDAFVDTVMDEVDDIFKRTVEARAKFEMNHMYPPAGTSEAAKIRWKLMLPVEKRKEFILDELRKCTATTVIKMVNLVRLMEGPGPLLYKGTMDKLIRTLVYEGAVKRAIAPIPEEWSGLREPPVRSFGTGEMLVQADAPTDLASMIGHAKKFREFENAVAKEIARIKREKDQDERQREEASQSKKRLLVYKRKMHRTMILHRELLRCLPKLSTQKEEHRIIDLDRVVLDIPLIMFMTMFGYPPDYLHAKELHSILKIAENEKATVREAPRAIWELMRHNGWFKDALSSSLQVLHDMSVLTKIDPAKMPSRDDTSTAGNGGGVVDPLAHSHASAKFPLVVCNRASGKGGDSAIELYDETVKAVAAERGHLKRREADGSTFYVSKRGLRKDRKARSTAAQALLQAKDPPAEMKIGLGWACLRTDLAVYAAERTFYKRVSDDTQWWDFWNTYQMYGTGQRNKSAPGLEMKFEGTKIHQVEATSYPGPLSQSILAKVPELADPAEWGVDDSYDTATGDTPWHKSGKMWTQEEDVELLRIISKAYRDPTVSIPRASRIGRPSTSMAYREAIRPFAKSVNRSVGACWKRYRKLEDKYGGGPSMLLPISRQKRLALESDKADGNETIRRKKTKKSRQSGLLARDGPLSIGDLDPLRKTRVDLNEARKTAREEATIAKAAGFEWVNEEGAWDEDHPGGGISPRPFNRWNWSLEELAAFTAIRQLLLVPETRFSPGRAMERLKDLRPPTIQKAYRVLMSLSQIDFTEEAWEANTMSVQDCIDHEVYKMIGRHGSDVVRGIVATKKLRDVSQATNWSNPLALGGKESGKGDGLSSYKQLSRSMSLKDVGTNGDKLSAVLEAVARGRACFTVSPADFNICHAEDGAASGQANNQLGSVGAGEASSGRQSQDQLASGIRSKSLGSAESSARVGSEAVDEATTSSTRGGDLAAKYCRVAIKYRTTRIIDADIMAAAMAEIIPVAAADGGTGVEGSRDGAGASLMGCRDAHEVRGPETEWGAPANGCREVSSGNKLTVLLKALGDGKENGLTLPQLRRAVQRLQGANVSVGSEEVELAALGCGLRTGAAICVCGAEDVKYIHKRYLKRWLVPMVNGVESQPTTPTAQMSSGHSRPTPMEVVEKSVEDEDEPEMDGSATAHRSKGKGRLRLGTERCADKAVNVHDCEQSGVWFPWMAFDGEVDLGLLSRIRQGLVAFIRKHPGSTAGEIREEFPYLSGGEIMLLLKDLVRRKVLLEDTVQDTSKVTIASGWGLACQNGTWPIEDVGIGDELDGDLSRTAFLTAPEWFDAMLRVIPAEHTRTTS